MADKFTTNNSFKPYVYRCPHEGDNCSGKKHCHILETLQAIPCPMTVLVKCPMQKNAKIEVTIGA